MPEWSELSAEARAQKLLDRINEKLSEADAPPQLGVLFSSSEEENLRTVRRMIEHFEEDRS